jgi:uncharacterized protein (UPF0332 family)
LTTDQKLWLEKAYESIRASELLAQNGLFKSAVSRAYYAMFYVATGLLLNKGLRFKSHSAVIAAFGQHFAATGLIPREYHRYLINAFDERNLADYETGQDLTGNHVVEKIGQAEQFLALAEKLLGPVSEQGQ